MEPVCMFFHALPLGDIFKVLCGKKFKAVFQLVTKSLSTQLEPCGKYLSRYVQE